MWVGILLIGDCEGEEGASEGEENVIDLYSVKDFNTIDHRMLEKYFDCLLCTEM